MQEEYDIIADTIVRTQSGGYLNTNYFCESEQGKFFLQHTDKERRLYINEECAVLNFLEETNIPSPRIFPTKAGKYYSEKQNLLLVYEYIEGHSPDKFHDLSEEELVAAAQTLGELHLALEAYDGRKINNSSMATKEEALTLLATVEATLAKKDVLDDFDSHIKTILGKKKKLLSEAEEPNFGGCKKGFCHGDYHGANLIFNKGVVGIVDWEYFGNDYRVWEVARSMAFMCDKYHTGSLLSEIDLERASRYLQTYHSVNPLTKEEWNVLPDLLAYKSLCSIFVIKQHYEYSRTVTDVFLPKDTAHWFWWVENKEKFRSLLQTLQ